MSDEPANNSNNADALLLSCLSGEFADRRSELERLCREHPEESATLRRMFESLERLGFTEEPGDGPALPSRFGPYEVIRLLGTGGMGAVYLAMHDSLRRRVALKALHTTLRHDDRARDRFRREALATAQLDDPAICPVHDVGEVEGLPFLAMRYVRGESLDRYIARAVENGRDALELPSVPGAKEQTSRDALLAFFEIAALALHTAHDAGLVHRDVKPGNLMVTPTGEPVLLDFGLARLDEGGDDRLTMSGDRLGTPLYMAPEQVAGGEVGRETDVYALGAVLFEALMLRPPFEAERRQRLFEQILNSEPDGQRELRGRWGRDVATVVETAMAKEPSRRYRTARDLALDLRRLREGRPIAARPESALRRASRFVRRYPLAATLLFALMAGLVGALLLLAERDRALRTKDAIALANQSEQIAGHTPELALSVALEAVRSEPRFETVSALYGSVIRSHERVRVRHEAAVGGAAFSPTGDRFLSWSHGGIARLWQLDGTPVCEPMRHGGAIPDAEFAADGRFVTTDNRGLTRIWSAAGDLDKVLVHPPRAGSISPRIVRSPRFSPDGTLVLTTSLDGRAFVWNSRTGELVREFARHDGILRMNAAWSPTDHDLVATGEDWSLAQLGPRACDVLLWRPSTGETVHTLPGHEASVSTVDFSPDGRLLVSASTDRTARVWSVDSGTCVAVLRGHEDGVRSARFRSDGERIVTAAADGLIKVWTTAGDLLESIDCGNPVGNAHYVRDGLILARVRDGSVRLYSGHRELVSLRGHSRVQVSSAAMSADGDYVLSASWDGSVRLWGLRDEQVPRLHAHRGAVRGLAIRGNQLVSAGVDLTVAVRSLDSVVSRTFSLPAIPFHDGIRLSRDGDELLVACADSIGRLISMSDGAVLAEYRDAGRIGLGAIFVGEDHVVTGGNYSIPPDSRATGESEELVLWTRGGERLKVFSPLGVRTWALDDHASTDRIATGSWDRRVRVWTSDGQPVETFVTRDWINSVAFSPSGRWLAAGSADNSVWVFDLEDSTVDPKPLGGHESEVLVVEWSPDGRLLASGSGDATVRLWRARDGEPIAVLRGHSAPVRTIEFDDRGRIWTGGDDGVIQAWPLPEVAPDGSVSHSKLVEIAESRLLPGPESASHRAPVPGRDRVDHVLRLLDYGDVGLVVESGRELLESASRADEARALNRLAWAIVDPQQSSARRTAASIDLAVDVAERAVSLTSRRNSQILDTLARAHFWAGDVAKAFSIQEEAVRLPGGEAARDALEEYRALLNR